MALGQGNELVARGRQGLLARGARATAGGRGSFRGARTTSVRWPRPNTSAAGVEFDLLLEFEDARRTGEAAFMHFRAVDDELGAQRANLLVALAETNIAAEKKGNDRELRCSIVTRRRWRPSSTSRRTRRPPTRCAPSTCKPCPTRCAGALDRTAKIYEVIRRRAHARGDKFLEAGSIQNLAYVAHRNGELAKAASMYESVLPLIERDRNPDLYATIIGNLGVLADRARRFRSRAHAAVRSARAVHRARRHRPDRARPSRRWERSSSAPATWNAPMNRCAAPSRSTAAPETWPGGHPRCASWATRPPSSASTTWRWSTCARPNISRRTSTPSRVRAYSSPGSCARSATCAARRGCWAACC